MGGRRAKRREATAQGERIVDGAFGVIVACLAAFMVVAGAAKLGDDTPTAIGVLICAAVLLVLALGLFRLALQGR